MPKNKKKQRYHEENKVIKKIGRLIMYLLCRDIEPFALSVKSFSDTTKAAIYCKTPT